MGSAGASSRFRQCFAFFFLGFLTYNVVGAVYNYKRHFRRGVEAIPHINKWRNLPTKVCGVMSKATTAVIGWLVSGKTYIKRKWQGYSKL
mmetsp:Transcript_5597/g.4270  ORF Transcript_5597/g.4270 Transcript_5597/m.4270 type:complete len:90 (-) Transcript_5597:54-323(-)